MKDLIEMFGLTELDFMEMDNIAKAAGGNLLKTAEGVKSLLDNEDMTDGFKLGFVLGVMAMGAQPAQPAQIKLTAGDTQTTVVGMKDQITHLVEFLKSKGSFKLLAEEPPVQTFEQFIATHRYLLEA
jgi:hypothetical protein